ncbi:hypothetical protein AB833_26675 [Chromatiales bacterium (ex Bugula neritina AB1)]|nr:hypothetical protein AB833_26675 [Chromatiales bacterium (ex Bugula neritina AB1)]
MNAEIQRTILSIYDTVADQNLWQSVLDRCRFLCGASSCAIFDFREDNKSRPFNVTQTCSSPLAELMGDYVQSNLSQEVADRNAAKLMTTEKDGIDILSDIITFDNYDEFLQRENVKYLERLGLRQRAISFLNKDNYDLDQFTLQFSTKTGIPDSNQFLVMGMILPHVAKALDLSRPVKQLANEREHLLAALHHLTIGVCILDSKGRIVLTNDEFKRQKETYEVFTTGLNDELCFLESESQRQFMQLKSGVMNHGKFGARPRKEAIAVDTNIFLCIEVTPLTRSEEFGSKNFDGYILYSADTSRPVRCNTLLMKQAYGLTGAELSLIELIAEGLTNRQIADRRNRSISTVNTQVKAILSKTHCSTRTQFVRLMMSFGVSGLSD